MKTEIVWAWDEEVREAHNENNIDITLPGRRNILQPTKSRWKDTRRRDIKNVGLLPTK